MDSEIKICLTVEASKRDKLYDKYKSSIETGEVPFRDLLNMLDIYLSVLESDIKRDNTSFSDYVKGIEFTDYDDYFDRIYALNRVLREKFHGIEENTVSSIHSLEEKNLQRDFAAMNTHIHFLENRIWELELLPSVRSHLLQQDEQSVLELKEKVDQNERHIRKLEQKLKERTLSSNYYHDCFVNCCNEIDNLKNDLTTKDVQLSELREQLSKQKEVSSQDLPLQAAGNISYSKINLKTFFITIASIIISIVIGVISIHFNLFGLFLTLGSFYFFILYIYTVDAETTNPILITVGTLAVITIVTLFLVYFLNHNVYDATDSSAISRSSYSYISSSTMVWVDDTAKRYHKKNGCNMDNAYQVTIERARAMGKTPCGNCY